MLSGMICLKYLKNGTCPNSDCKLRHVKDTTTMELAKRPSTTPLSAASSVDVKMLDTATEGFKKMEDPEKKKKPCEYLFVKGFCKMGAKCFYSHEATKPGARLGGGASRGSFSSRGGSGFGGRGGLGGDRRGRGSWGRGGFTGERGGFSGIRGGFRGGRGGFSALPDVAFPMDPFDFDVPDVPHSRMRHSGGGKVIRLQQEDRYEDLDVTDFAQQLQKMYKDLLKLEPIRRIQGNKTLDMMFIIDCTGSMGSWIEACKREIKSIIDCIRNQFFNIQIRVSIVAYRDHCDGNLISEVFPFSHNIDGC